MQRMCEFQDLKDRQQIENSMFCQIHVTTVFPKITDPPKDSYYLSEF